MKIRLIILLLLFSSAIQATTYYVSSSGNTTNSGLTTSETWSLAKVNSFTFSAGDQILLKRGDTFYGNIKITESGTLVNPIAISAYGSGAKPIVTGFVNVTSWVNLGSNIWESTNAVSGQLTCNMVVINGVNTEKGRLPNKSNTKNGGYLTIDSHTSTSITSSEISGAVNWTGARLVVRPNRWSIDEDNITSQSGSTLNYTSMTTPTDGYGFFINNDARTLDSQNEWYYNPTTKKLRIYSVSVPSNVKVAARDSLLFISGNYTTAENLQLIGANTRGISAYKTYGSLPSNVIITNCDVSYAGNYGIYNSGTKSTIQNCTVNESNWSGIAVPKAGISSILNNVVTNTARFEASNAGAGILGNYENKSTNVEGNRIINSGESGINVNGDSTIFVKNNFIDTYCTVTDDAGGIYVGGQNYSSRITENIFLNGIGNGWGTTDTMSYAAHGIYLDEHVENIEVDNNTVGYCGSSGILIHSAANNNIHNNTVYAASPQISLSSKLGSLEITGNTITANKFIARMAIQKVLGAVTYSSITNPITEFGAINNNYYARPIDDSDGFHIQTSASSSTKDSLTFEEWKSFSGFDANSNKSPKSITDVNDLQFYYNDSESDSVITLPYRSIDVSGAIYQNSTILQPFESIVLIKDNVSTNYHVSSTGSDSNDGLSTETPWLTLYHACATVPASNSIINLASGIYIETQTSILAEGVSIIGSGISTIIKSSLSADWVPIIKLTSAEGTNGNQSISNLKFDGQNLTTAWAIECRGRSNVSIHDCTFIDFRQYGVWFGGRNDNNDAAPEIHATGNSFYNNIVTNCADMSGENAKGCLAIGGQDGMIIHDNTITNNVRANGTNGYPIKYANSGYNKNLKIYLNALTADKKIAGGWAFAIELWRSQGGIEIYNNTITGSIDIATASGGIDIHHNTIGYPSFANNSIETAVILEGDIDNVNIHHNLVSHCAVGVMLVYNQNMSFFRNVSITYNVFKKLGTTAATWQTFGISATGSDANITGSNLFIYNNTIEADATIGASPYFGISTPRVGTFSNCQIKNNIVIGFNTAIESSFTANLDSLNISNNITFNNSNDISVTNNPTNYTNVGNLTSNPLFLNNSDYYLKYQSPARSTGINVGLNLDFDGIITKNPPSIGACEYRYISTVIPYGLNGKFYKF